VTPPPAEVWFIDFEFRITPGWHPFVRCMVAREYFSGRELRLWRNQLLALRRSPFPDHAVLVAFYASAEAGCFLELGWEPRNFIDLYIEHRGQTNGLPRPKRERKKQAHVQSGKTQKSEGRDSLLGALALRGLAHIDVDDKRRMRELVLTEDDPSPAQVTEILDYCASDVIGTEALFRYMFERGQIDQPRALWRGRYAIAAARMERVGIPIDVPLHQRLSENWAAIRHALIVDVNRTFRVFDEHDAFKTDWFADLLVRLELPWPKLPSGALALDLDTFDDMARFHPILRPLYEVRSSLGETRLTGLSIGPDGHNRCLLSIFQTVTGRNAPSPSEFVFGPARWMRGLIKPPLGYGLAYVDWSAQEIAIAAALSSDERMIAAYLSGDPYLAFARDAALVPVDATKHSHVEIRETCKTIVLGINYGMGPDSMAVRADITRAEARSLLSLHRHTYKRFWQWAENTVATALFSGEMQTQFGWRRRTVDNPNVRSIQNWPVQSCGAEMMRAAAIAATEAGIAVCAPVHDAFLIMAPLDCLEADVAAMRAIMTAAAEAIIGIPIRTDAKIVLPPDRYMDPRGEKTWNKIMGLLEVVESQAAA
jgi:DNA polymerase-1